MIGTAPLDLGDCLLCKKRITTIAEMLAVEMNRDAEGNFHATQDHLNHAERVAGVTHRACYKDWYEKTYGTPFTMTADG